MSSRLQTFFFGSSFNPQLNVITAVEDLQLMDAYGEEVRSLASIGQNAGNVFSCAIQHWLYRGRRKLEQNRANAENEDGCSDDETESMEIAFLAEEVFFRIV